MNLVDEPVWRRFWYPVAFAADVADAAPVARTLLGTRVVLWPGSDGEVLASVDRCPHRDAALSQGWLCGERLVCPYHGWQFGTDGVVEDVPQTPGVESFPERYGLDMVSSRVHAGVVWLCLDPDPLLPLPDVPTGDGEQWRFVREFDEVWDTSAPRLMENSFDIAHTTFVHRDTFGDTSKPEVQAPEVERTPHGIVARSAWEVLNPEYARASTGEEGPTTLRTTQIRLYAPFLRVLEISYPSGRVHQIVTAATPVDDDHLRLVQWAVRNDTETDAPAAQVVDFDRRVTLEDKGILEGIWWPYSPELSSSVHIKVDRATVEIRRLYLEILAGTWPSAAPAAAPASVADATDLA